MQTRDFKRQENCELSSDIIKTVNSCTVDINSDSVNDAWCTSHFKSWNDILKNTVANCLSNNILPYGSPDPLSSQTCDCQSDINFRSDESDWLIPIMTCDDLVLQ